MFGRKWLVAPDSSFDLHLLQRCQHLQVDTYKPCVNIQQLGSGQYRTVSASSTAESTFCIATMQDSVYANDAAAGVSCVCGPHLGAAGSHVRPFRNGLSRCLQSRLVLLTLLALALRACTHSHWLCDGRPLLCIGQARSPACKSR